PGTVFVGDSTHRATEASVVYEDAGVHEMKGKAEPAQLWRATRVVAGRGGNQKSTHLEAPFVGRDRELRMMKDLMHASAEDRRAHLVSVTGIAGIGKSRLVWEFEKYVDGLAATYRWHRGRCLAYGEGVTYWALAEMVRMRAGIVEGEDQASALEKLGASIAKYVEAPDEREWITPRLAHLLGLEERTARDAEDLFSAWRLFFERISAEAPVILVFEDMQWADRSLVDFVDYLMNWSKNHPIFVVVHARPEFLDRHPGWGQARRGSTAIYLEPLRTDEMDQLLAGLVPGLPAALRAKILDRAAGVPLYAVETVRMLLDRGLLVQEGATYTPVGAVEDLQVPETLQALIAARLDGLEPAERKLLQDAAVVGKTFTKSALVAITGLADADLEQLLASLLRKELLSIQADPRSPERGQYGFLQDLVRRVAYDTLSKKDRKVRHLAAAVWLEEGWGADDEEIVEVVASHYIEALQAAPDAPDAPQIKAKVLEALDLAGRRAASLAAGEEALRYYERAIEIADDPVRRAELHERAGWMARLSARDEQSAKHYDAAVRLFKEAGQTHPAARVSAAHAMVIRLQGRGAEAIVRMEAALEVMSAEEPDQDLATLEAELSRALYFGGRFSEAMPHVERALEIAEAQQLPANLAEGLTTKAMILQTVRRPEEALVLLQHALKVALDNDLTDTALRCYNNLGATMNDLDRHDEELAMAQRMVELARKVGNRHWERQGLGAIAGAKMFLGDWDAALADVEELLGADRSEETRSMVFLTELTVIGAVYVHRGDMEAARNWLALLDPLKDSTGAMDLSSYKECEAWVLFGEGRYADAVATATAGAENSRAVGFRNPAMKYNVVALIEAALAGGDLETAERWIVEIEALPPVDRSPHLVTLAERVRALLAIARGTEEDVETRFLKAVDGFRAVKMAFWIAVTSLDLGSWLVSQGREPDAKPVLDEAAEIFGALRAGPWLERVEQVYAGNGRAASAGRA
ncbi:MAG: AAA family ATPase, partial [Actinomycetota bacterium]